MNYESEIRTLIKALTRLVEKVTRMLDNYEIKEK